MSFFPGPAPEVTGPIRAIDSTHPLKNVIAIRELIIFLIIFDLQISSFLQKKTNHLINMSLSRIYVKINVNCL